MMVQPTLIDVKIPDDNEFTVCGDIHGQYYDLMNIFQINGLPSETNPYVSQSTSFSKLSTVCDIYDFIHMLFQLFNGDFVDRGSFSVECILTLLGFKLLYPNHFFMARGM